MSEFTDLACSDSCSGYFDVVALNTCESRL
jgi:hypothetical protein